MDMNAIAAGQKELAHAWRESKVPCEFAAALATAHEDFQCVWHSGNQTKNANTVELVMGYLMHPTMCENGPGILTRAGW